MIPQTRKYFVITVHFGEKQATDALLASLLHGSLRPHHIVIIDHADTAYLPAVASDIVRTIRPHQNNGYAGGINLALGALVSMGVSSQDIVICLNNDVVLAQDDLQKIHEWVTRQPSSFVAGPTVGVLNYGTGRTRLTHHGLPQATWTTASYVHGSCIVAPMQVYADAKGLPEQFFLYWEDVAFSAQAIKAGAVVKTIPNLGLSHPDTRPPSADQLLYLVRNGAWYLEHQLPHIWRIYWYLGNRLRYIWHKIAGKQSVALALKAASKNNLGPIKKMNEVHPCPPDWRAPTWRASLGAVVVTHNNQVTLAACLQSLQKAGIQNIVVVDNASTDKTLTGIPGGVIPRSAEESPADPSADVRMTSWYRLDGVSIRVVKNTQNIGFGAAANQGASLLKNDYFLFLNPDAQLEGSLEEVLQAMNKDLRLGIVGLGLYDKEGKLEPHSFGPFPTLPNLFLRKLNHFLISYFLFLISPVDWVSAGAMLVRRQTWQDVGGFDPEFFMYWEDIDLCRRASKAGWTIAYLPELHVIHQRGASLSDVRKKTQFYDASADRYFKKHYSWYIWGIQHFGRRLYRGLFPRVS